MSVDELATRRAEAIEGTRELADLLAQPDPIDPQWLIESPGVYPDLPDWVYLRDPVVGGSLSSHGARLLLPPSCPAMFHYRRTHPRPPKDEYDIGHAAHRMVLGVGPEIVEVKFDDWRTKAAQKAKKDAHAVGKVPLLTETLRRVETMAEAVKAHPTASYAFDPEHGDPEQTLVWVDDETGVRCRARLDWQPDLWDGRFVIPDFKTSDSADKGAFARSAAKFGYAQQAAFYQDGVIALGLDDDPAFVFVVIERDPPHLINVIELDQPSLDAGRRRNRAALDIYARCMETGEWPGHSDDVELVTLPQWYLMHDPSPRRAAMSNNEVAVRHGSGLAIEPQQEYWTQRQIAALAQIGVEDAGPGDLTVFFHTAQRTGLDPFIKQITMIKRNTKKGPKWTIQIQIDGFRLIARRAADRAGETIAYEGPEWADKDGRWRDVWLYDNPPSAARVTVFRDGRPFPGVAMWREFSQTDYNGNLVPMWKDMPANQLAKCAEAQALRKAYPHDLGGLYIDDEMQGADRTASTPPRRVTAAEIRREPEPDVDVVTGEVDTGETYAPAPDPSAPPDQGWPEVAQPPKP